MAKVQEIHGDHIDPVGHFEAKGSYAIDQDKDQVTVLGTLGQDPNEKKSVSWRSWAIVVFCTLAVFQNTFIGIAPAANSYTIAGALNGMDKRIWIIQAQGVPSIATGPIFAIVSDVYGRRYVLLATWTLFCIASIISMTAKTVDHVIIGQALTGVASGTSGMMLAIASEVLPSTYRSHVQTALNAFSGAAPVLALVGVGGIVSLEPIAGWRWIFRIQLILSGLVLLGFAFVYFPPPRTRAKGTLWQKAKTLDWIGYFLLLGGLTPLLIGFAYSSDRNYGWSSKHSWLPVVVGFIMFGICLLYEWKGTSTGFLDHRLFRDGRNFPLAIFVIAVEGSLFYLVNNVYSAQVFGLWMPTASPVIQGAHLLPFFMVITFLAPFMSIYVTKRKDIKWPLCFGFSFFSVAIIVFALAGENKTIGLVGNALGGIGFCAPLILVVTLVQLSTPPLFIGVASALTISARTIGGTVGYAIAEAIYAAKTNTQTVNAIASTAISMGFPPQNVGQLIGAVLSHGSLDGIPGLTGPITGAVFAAVNKVSAHGYKLTWLSFLPGTVIAAIACAFMVNPKARMNWIVDAPMEASKDATSEMEQRRSSPDVEDDKQIDERVERI